MSHAKQPLRIGNAHAFWGDRADAAVEMLAREPELDYVTLDYLAEVSMSILAMQRERDVAAGFARDFIEVIESVAPYWAAGGKCKLITNAGGLNPRGCAEAVRAALEHAGCRALKIGVVSGDDVLEKLRGASSNTSKFQNLDTGAAIDTVRDRLITANAYLGAAPIVEALAEGADIVITGRIADPSLVVAPCVHHFGWNDGEHDKLAGATVAGHLIECGTQVTGGISTDWLNVPGAAGIGFPIVEVAEDGSCIVTKPPGTGGCVSPATVKEQLVYEIGDPANYLSPDVTVSILSLKVEDLGDDRVSVSGAIGRPRPNTLKVSATYRDGFRAAGTLTIVGRDTNDKAKRCGEIILGRLRDAGFTLRDSVVEAIGGSAGDDRFGETVMRIAVEAESREPVERFSRELMSLITAGPQGVSGYAAGRPTVQPVFRYWPCLVERGAVMPRVTIVESVDTSSEASQTIGLQPGRRGDQARAVIAASKTLAGASGSNPFEKPAANATHLYAIARARSGDKGMSANVGVIARNAASWEFLRNWLSAERVAEFFAPLGVDSVERFELANLQALNFVIHGILKNGLRNDAQGKALGQKLLEMQLPPGALRRNNDPL
jgi:hypothetical protein